MNLSECRAEILSERGNVLFTAEDESIRFSAVSGSDINDDGFPEIVIEGQDCGASGCSSQYWILSIKVPLTMLLHISVFGGFLSIADLAGDGHFEFIGTDEAFENFAGLSAVGSPRPQVILRLEGKHLKNISREFWNSPFSISIVMKHK